MHFILDTNIVTLLMYGNSSIEELIRAHQEDTICITTVTIEETIGGWYALLRQAKTFQAEALASSRLANTFVLLREFPIEPVTEASLQHAKRLLKAKLNIGKADLKIAALALELQATVVTNNTRDFSRVPGLQWEDWSV